jgi:hypothetical protein
MPFPLGVWRVDSVLLIVLSFPLLAASAGRWVLGRVEGSVLIVAFALYLLLVTIGAFR